MSARDDALTVLLVKVVRDRLALIDGAARARLLEDLAPGARWPVLLEDVEVGGVTRTKPTKHKPTPTVVDREAFTAWVAAVRPDEVVSPPAPPTPPPAVRPSYEKAVLIDVAAGVGDGNGGPDEWLDPMTGELLPAPPGVEWTTATSSASSHLRVTTTEEGDAALLEALRVGTLALPAVLDALEGATS